MAKSSGQCSSWSSFGWGGAGRGWAGQGNRLGLAGWIVPEASLQRPAVSAVAPGPGNLGQGLSAGRVSPGSQGSCIQLWPCGSAL